MRFLYPSPYIPHFFAILAEFFYLIIPYPLLLTFIEFLGKIPLSFIGHFFELFRKGAPIFYY